MKIRPVSLLVSLLIAGCASHSTTFSSSRGKISISHDAGSETRAASYRICGDSGAELGQVKSIISAKAVANVPGLPVNQEVIWSPSGKTAVIYENMSDASPDYQFVLIRLNPDMRNFDARQIDLGTRSSSMEDIYGEWPTVVEVSDSAIGLEWSSDPRSQTVEISELLSN